MKRRFAVLVIASVATVMVAVSAQAAPLSKAIRFTNRSGKVTCGIEIHTPGKAATEVLCAAKGIPPPKTQGVGDSGFVQIGVFGKPRVLRLSQNSWVAGHAVRLGRGRLWNQLGVTCHMGAVTVMCFNGANHGFVIGNGHYRTF
jgi:hypothetical protein